MSILFKIFLFSIIILALILFYFLVLRSPSFSKISPNSSNLLFIGDSLTAYSNSYADQLKQQNPDINIKKIALGSQETSWMLDQFKAELLTGNKYDAIIIWGGLNDIYITDSIDKTKNNLNEIYRLAKQNSSQVIALTIVPNSTHNLSTPQRIKLTNDLNRWIKSNKKINAVIDVNALLNDGKGGTKDEYLQADNIHLTDSGHTIIENEFSQKIFYS